MLRKCNYDVNLFKLAKEVNATDTIAGLIAFQPPKKHEYIIEQITKPGCCFIASQNQKNNRYEKVKFLHEKFTNISYNWIEEDCYIIKKTKKASGKYKNIVAIHLKNKNKIVNGFTILMSHGNASTIGTIYPILVDICTQLKCDIVSYDYSGYGKSDGKPSEKEIYLDIESVGNFMIENLHIPPREIILFGHSLGSAPSIHLAITEEFRDVRAIILLSPIASGVRLVSPDFKLQDLEKIDVFCNIKKIIDVTCPIFLIHGQHDEVIPLVQSLEMAKFMKYPYEWFPRNGDHSNILTKYRTKFFQKCKFFFEYIEFNYKKNSTTKSFLTYSVKNYNEKYKNIILHKNGEEIPILQSEENYLEKYIVRHPFTSKEKYYFQLSESQIDIHQGDTNRISRKRSSSRVSAQNGLGNSQVKEYLFDLISEPDNSPCKTNNNEDLDSKISYIHLKTNKDLEEQYNRMLIKHNGI